MKRLRIVFTAIGLCFSFGLLAFGVLAITDTKANITGSVEYVVENAFVEIQTKVYKSKKYLNSGQIGEYLDQITESDFNTNPVDLGDPILTSEVYTSDPYQKTNYLYNNLNLSFSSGADPVYTYFFVVNIKNLNPNENVWAIMDDSAFDYVANEYDDDFDDAQTAAKEIQNTIQVNNGAQPIIDENGKNMVMVLGVDNYAKKVNSSPFNYQINIGVGDLDKQKFNTDKLSINTENGTVRASNMDIKGVVVLPTDENITTIEDYYGFYEDDDFTSCKFITNVIMSDNITYIGEMAFSGCSSLTHVNLPNQIESIASKTFENCSSLISITIPESVTEIGDAAFFNCKSLSSITMLSQTPPTLGDALVFYKGKGYSQNIIKVPDGALNAYITADYWDKYIDYIEGADQYVVKQQVITFGSYPQSMAKGYNLTNPNSMPSAENLWVYDSTNTSSPAYNLNNNYVGTLPTQGQQNSDGWVSYNYYISNSNTNHFMWYKDVDLNSDGQNDYRGVYFTSYRPNSTGFSSTAIYSYQDDNGLALNTVYWYKYEPIQWAILTQADGTALVLSEYILDSQQYYNNRTNRTINSATIYPNNYKESDIRQFLNNNFLNGAFTQAELDSILTTTVDNSASSTNPNNNPTEWNNGENQYACENTQDKIFLLSGKEVTNSDYGFDATTSNNIARIKLTTDYAQAQGAFTDTNIGSGDWWLRSPNFSSSNSARRVNYYGNAVSNYLVDLTYFGVVPALYIQLEVE